MSRRGCSEHLKKIDKLSAAGSFHISLPIRSLFLALALCSILLLEVCFRRYLWPSAAALAIFLFEVYWIIPKWNSKYGDPVARAE
jgi:hypothetical protein